MTEKTDTPEDLEPVDLDTRRTKTKPKAKVPAKARKPQDRKPKAIEAEAVGVEHLTIDFEGKLYSFPADPLDWPTRAVQAFEEGKAVTAIKALIGEKRCNQVGIDDWPLRKTTALFDLFAQESGLGDAGE